RAARGDGRRGGNLPIPRRRAVGKAAAREPDGASARWQRRGLLEGARRRQSFPVPRLERRTRPARVDPGAGDAGGSRQMRRQLPGRFPAELLRILFERTRIDPRLAEGREDLYREASRYAEKFCRRLERSLRRNGAGTEGEVLRELRRFYRLSNARKLAHIDTHS